MELPPPLIFWLHVKNLNKEEGNNIEVNIEVILNYRYAML